MKVAAALACLVLCGCTVSRAQNAYEQSVAEYRACLAANANNTTACDAKRSSMEAQERLWNDLRCATYGGAMCNTLNAKVSVESRP